MRLLSVAAKTTVAKYALRYHRAVGLRYVYRLPLRSSIHRYAQPASEAVMHQQKSNTKIALNQDKIGGLHPLNQPALDGYYVVA